MAFKKGSFKQPQHDNYLNPIKNISLSAVESLIEANTKLLFISINLGIYSDISKLYYILKNSKFNDKIYPSDTLTFDKRTMTRIRSNIKVKGLHEIKEQCVFVYYKNITPAMLNNRILILMDWKLSSRTSAKLEPIIKKLIKQYRFNYKFEERLVHPKELRLESYDENEIRRSFGNDISRIPPKDQKYLIFDTETNGLPTMLNYKCVPYNYEHGWDNCRMLSIGWLVVDNKFNVLNQEYHLIRDETIFNSIHTQKINKILDSDRNENGLLFGEVIDKFFRDLDECEYIVSHGSDFDFNLLIHECILHDVKYDIFKDKIVLNTKQNLWKENHKLGLSDIVKVSEQIDLEAHHALYDCYLCLELLKIRLGI